MPSKHTVMGSNPVGGANYLCMAQLGRARVLGTRGRGFKSLYTDQISLHLAVGGITAGFAASWIVERVAMLLSLASRD